jgi:hypothetical protein bfra3_21505
MLAGLLCWGCKQTDVTQVLDRAETCMAERPDSSLYLLRTLDKRHISGSLRKARYALLYSQALDKNYIDVDNDSLIRVAVDYYKGHGTSHEKALAYFYLGRVYDNAGDETRATEAFVEAETHALDTDDHYICGLIYSYLGNLYFSQYSFDEALAMYDKSEKCYAQAGQLRNEGYMVEAKARVYKLQHLWDNSLNEYNKAKEIFFVLNDFEQILFINRAISIIQFQSGKQIDLTIDLLKSLYSENKIYTLPVEDYPLWSMISLKNKDLDKAREYALLSLSNKDSLSERQLAGLYALLIEIESSAKNYSKALEYSGEYEKIMENIDEYERHNLIQEIEHKYKNRQLKDQLEAEEKYHFYQLKIISLLIFLAIIIALYIINHLIKRKRRIIIEKNKEIEIYKIMADDLASNYTELKNLYDRLGAERDQEDETETRFMKALDNRLKGLGDLLEEAYLFENKPERFLKTFKDYVKESSAQEFAFSDLRYIVNKKYCGIVDYLQKTYSDLSESDLDLCSMICFGFSSNSIRQIYAHTNPDSIYNKRSKLRNKLKLGPSIQIEGFIRNLLAELSRKETA